MQARPLVLISCPLQHRLYAMNTFSAERRTAIVVALMEGNSVRSVCRMSGAARRTVLRLLVEVGRACAQYHDGAVRGVKARRVQCDESWSFCYAKERNMAAAKAPAPNAGDAWTWAGLDADSKLAVSYLGGDRSGETANSFVRDLVGRLANLVGEVSGRSWSIVSRRVRDRESTPR